MKLKHYIFLSLIGLVFANVLLAQSAEPEPRKVSQRGCTAEILPEQHSISILDTYRFQIRVEAPEGSTIRFPFLIERLEDDFRVVPWKFDKREKEDGKLTRIKYVAIEPNVSGRLTLPPLAIEITSSNGDVTKLRTPPLEFKVEPVSVDKVWEKDLEPPADPAKLPLPEWVKYLWFLLALPLVFLAGFYLAKKLKGKTERKAPPVPPDELAWRELRHLIQLHKEEKINDDTLLQGITDVLRRYIERRFQLRAPELTTEEFLERLPQAGPPLSDYMDQLQPYLDLCDMVKFAKRPASEADIQKGFELVKDFIDKTKPQGNGGKA